MMKKILIALVVVSTALIAGESAAASKVDDGVKRTFTQLDNCIAESDAKCVGELLVDDATFFQWASGTLLKGKAQIVKSLEAMMGPSKGKPGGAKQTHTVQNIRTIGEDHALVDCEAVGVGTKPGEGVHTVGVMVLKGDKWLFEDLRSYVIDTRKPAEKEAQAKQASQGGQPAPGTPGQTPPPPGAPPTPPPAAPSTTLPTPPSGPDKKG